VTSDGFPGLRYYDRDGMPISMERWGELHADVNYRRVALDVIDTYRVSTIWLGLDHAIGFAGEVGPHIFETMVFTNGTGQDVWMHRYSTEGEALAGHESVCAEIRVLMMSDSEDAARDSEHSEHGD
jgi:hypothetical protein